MDAFKIGQPVCTRLRRNGAINGQGILSTLALTAEDAEDAEENKLRVTGRVIVRGCVPPILPTVGPSTNERF
jgi:hypothetical protein